MIRILIFIFSVAFFAGLLTVLASVDGRTTAQAFGLKFDFHTGGAAIILLLIFAATIVFTSIYKDLRRLPRDLRGRFRNARRARGLNAIAAGLEAIAAGDAGRARRQARIAARNLDEPALTGLVAAQAAQLSGDEEEARKNFAAMLEAPDTAFLGLKGLYFHALRAGDRRAAKDYAERAFRLRPNAAWAFEALFSLALEAGAWGEARQAVRTARKSGAIETAKARRGEAALLAADAYAAAAAGQSAEALEEAEAALKLAPSLTPAAVLAARLHAEAGRRGRAAKILEQAFFESPHPALVKAHVALYEDEPVDKRAEHMKRLAERRADSREARLLMARRSLLLGDFSQARTMLAPLLEEAAFADECAMMAEAAAGERASLEGKPESAAAAADAWLKRAAAAPRDPTPGADGAFHLTREGWARLAREYMDHARLAPPPLEAGPSGVSAEEIKQLTPPPPQEGPPAAEEAAPAEAEAPAGAPNEAADENDKVDVDKEQDAAAASAGASAVNSV